VNDATIPDVRTTEPDPRTDRYERLVLARRFEEEVRRLQLSATIEGAVHLATGHEAVSVGVGSVLAPSDWVACTYRGHGHALARGVPPRALLAEMLGRRTGICGGRAGSMNIVARSYGLLGCFGIVGGSIAAATGAGLSLRDTGAVAVAFFGDGALNQGYLLESLNLAAVLRLPVLYVCENNLYSEYTRTDLMTAASITERIAGIGVDAERVDGMDVRATAAAAESALEVARSGGGPRFLEAATYRFVPHSRADPISYQPDEEVERWRARDPVGMERSRLIDEGVPPVRLDGIDRVVGREIAEAIVLASDDPFPDPGSILSAEFA
jgi:acetoin:2,6-dichlorophenolindophenol oxidoreductase subunit alpha